MPDREKVIDEWETILTRDPLDAPWDLINDTLALLKEQEAKQVKLYGKEEWIGLSCLCPDCKARWMGSKSETHFCPNCGRAVKRDDY